MLWNGLRQHIVEILIGLLSFQNGPESYLKIDEGQGAIIGALWQIVAPVGLCLVLVYFFLDWNKILVELGDSGSMKQTIMCFLKLAVSLTIISVGPALVSACVNFGNGMVNQATGTEFARALGEATTAAFNTDEFKTALENSLRSVNIGQLFMLAISLLVPNIVMFFVQIIIAYQAVSVKLEIILRAGAMPLALGDIYEGKNSNAVRNLKKLCALGIAGFLMIALCKIGTMLNVQLGLNIFIESVGGKGRDVAQAAGNIVNNGIGMTTGLIVIPLAVAGMCGTCKQLANDLLGC